MNVAGPWPLHRRSVGRVTIPAKGAGRSSVCQINAGDIRSSVKLCDQPPSLLNRRWVPRPGLRQGYRPARRSLWGGVSGRCSHWWASSAAPAIGRHVDIAAVTVRLCACQFAQKLTMGVAQPSWQFMTQPHTGIEQGIQRANHLGHANESMLILASDVLIVAEQHFVSGAIVSRKIDHEALGHRIGQTTALEQLPDVEQRHKVSWPSRTGAPILTNCMEKRATASQGFKS